MIRTLAGLVLSLTVALTLPHSALAGPVDAYELTQNDKTVGDQKVTVSARALRCEALATHIVLVSAAPDWNVVIYNPLTKRMHSKSYKDFSGYLQNQIVFFTGSSLAFKPVIPGGKGSYFGFPGRLFKEPPGYRATMMARYYKKMVVGGEPVEMIYKVLDFPGVPPQLQSVIERFYGLPERGGVPIDFSFHSVSEQNKISLSTRSVKHCKVDDSIFKIPAGLALTKAPEEVFLDGKSDDGSELIEIFGNESDAAGAKKKSK